VIVEKEIKKEIGKRIKIARIKLDLKQKDLSDMFECSRSNVAHIESGLNLPSLKYLYILHEKYKISIDWLMNGRGSMFVTISEQDEDVQRMLDDMSRNGILRHRILSYYFTEKSKFIKKKKNENRGK
jgi:transcriptional regulator with XRE-family HTH domain